MPLVATTVARNSPHVDAGQVLGGEHVAIVHVPAANLKETVSVVDCTVVAAPDVAGTVVVEFPALSIAIGASAEPAGIVFPSASAKAPETETVPEAVAPLSTSASLAINVTELCEGSMTAPVTTVTLVLVV